MPKPNLSRPNMAARIVSDVRRTERTIAIAAGLTYDEAVADVAPHLGADERIAEFVEYRF